MHTLQMGYLCRCMRIFAYILILGVFLQTCSKQLIYSDYLMNKEYISKVLCVNKNSPEKHCNGKCHLKKQLDQDTRQQEGDSQKVKAGTEVVYISPQELKLEIPAITVSEHFFFYQKRTAEKEPSSVFHPPGSFINC
jgi:hypothetical protein